MASRQVPDLNSPILIILNDGKPRCAIELVRELEKKGHVIVKQQVQKCLYDMLNTGQVVMERRGARPFWTRKTLVPIDLSTHSTEEKLPTAQDYSKLWKWTDSSTKLASDAPSRRHSLPIGVVLTRTRLSLDDESKTNSSSSAPLPDYIPFQHKEFPKRQEREMKKDASTASTENKENTESKENLDGYCNVCHITTTSRINLEQHVKGKAHAKVWQKLEMLRKLDRSGSLTMPAAIVTSIQYTKNPITELNELSMKMGLTCRYIEESFDMTIPHLPVFTMLVVVGDNIKARGTASSKSEARRIAAVEALERLKEDDYRGMLPL